MEQVPLPLLLPVLSLRTVPEAALVTVTVGPGVRTVFVLVTVGPGAGRAVTVVVAVTVTVGRGAGADALAALSCVDWPQPAAPAASRAAHAAQTRTRRCGLVYGFTVTSPGTARCQPWKVM